MIARRNGVRLAVLCATLYAALVLAGAGLRWVRRPHGIQQGELSSRVAAGLERRRSDSLQSAFPGGHVILALRSVGADSLSCRVLEGGSVKVRVTRSRMGRSGRLKLSLADLQDEAGALLLSDVTLELPALERSERTLCYLADGRSLCLVTLAPWNNETLLLLGVRASWHRSNELD